VLGLILIPPMGIAGGAIAMVFGTAIEVLAIYFAYRSVLRNYAFEPETGTIESI
jgi:O-antigen/teichoic acid export membrane protein